MSMPFLNRQEEDRRLRAALCAKPMELDVVAESMDRAALLVGEAKWTVSRADVGRIVAGLKDRVQRLPFVRGRRVVLAVWLKEKAHTTGDAIMLTPDDVFGALK